MPDAFDGLTIPHRSEKATDDAAEPETTDRDSDIPAADDSGHVETAYARKAGSSADIDGTHHHAIAPGEGEGTGIGESGG